MKKWYSRISLILSLILTCTMMTACSGLFGQPNVKAKVYITDESITLCVGQTVKLGAISNTDDDVLLESTKESVVVIDDDGYITGVSEGTAQIVASVKGAMAQCDVTVTAAQADDPEMMLTVSSASLYVGDTLALDARFTGANGEIEYYSTKESVATVTDDGLVTAVAAGEATVRASSGVYSASCAIKVKALPSGGTVEKPDDPNPSAPVDPDSPTAGSRKLVWSDEFNGSSLNTYKWSYQVGTQDNYNGNLGPQYWGNGELQYYTEGDNIKVSGGSLQIVAKREQRGDRPYTSSRIVTRDKANWTFGYIEARMKTPAKEGMWPAFWMLPQTQNNPYGGWAANGEIDIMEAKGRLNNKVNTTIHYGGSWPNNQYATYEYTMSSSTESWHTYAVDWRAGYIAWYVDGTEVYRLTNDKYYSESDPNNPSAPFDKPFYILLNLAVGGKYDNYVEPTSDFMQATMYVDYVRVYE